MRIGTFAGGFAAGVAVTLLVGLISQVFKDTPSPAIFASLPNKTTEIEPAVDSAVKARFPSGSTEDDLIADLSAMGFVIRNGERGLWADYTAGGSGCMNSFSVEWSATADRLIEEASGYYHLSCL
jgi:hypothetical protein